MKKLMIMSLIAGLAAVNFGAEETSDAQNWRILTGGYARGGIKTSFGAFSDRGEIYGAELDVQYRIFESDSFNLWGSIGGAFSPKQSIAKGSVSETTPNNMEFGLSSDMDIGYGELRLMLVPEYSITSDWSLGGRLGVAFDWIRADNAMSVWMNSIQPGFPGLPPTITPIDNVSDSTTVSEFTAQAIMGLQTVYRITDNLGLYAAVDYRLGDDVDLKKYGSKFASIDLSGWYTSVGVAVEF